MDDKPAKRPPVKAGAAPQGMDIKAQLAKLECQLNGLRRDLSSTRTLLDSTTDRLESTQADNDALQAEVSTLTDESHELSDSLGLSKSHIKTLVGILSVQGGAITYQTSELEELQDIVSRYEESASAPWLSRLRGLLGELLE